MKVQGNELFRLRFQTQVIFGRGIRERIVEYVKEFKLQSLVLLFDSAATSSGHGKQVRELLASGGFEILELEGPKSEPEIDFLEQLRARAKDFTPDGVIALGGGSTIDMGKGLAAVLTNTGPAASYQGFDKLEKPGLPFVAVPTLFGAGTEVTASAVMINRERKIKGGINGAYVFPKLALIDPELGAGAPGALLGATGLDALVHCIEGYVAKCSTPLSRMFSRQGAWMLLPALNRLAVDPGNIQATEELAFGSLLAIMGLMHSESGICGAISYPLGVHHAVPHGLGGGLCMPAAIRWNASQGCELYRDLVPGCLYNSNRAAEILADEISSLIKSFKLSSLGEFGVTSANAGSLAEEIFGFKGVLIMNPVPVTEPKIVEDLIISAI